MESGSQKKQNVDFSQLPIMQKSAILRTQETHVASNVTFKEFPGRCVSTTFPLLSWLAGELSAGCIHGLCALECAVARGSKDAQSSGVPGQAVPTWQQESFVWREAHGKLLYPLGKSPAICPSCSSYSARTISSGAPKKKHMLVPIFSLGGGYFSPAISLAVLPCSKRGHVIFTPLPPS